MDQRREAFLRGRRFGQLDMLPILRELITNLQNPDASFEFPSGVSADYGLSSAYIKDCIDQAERRLTEVELELKKRENI